MKTSNESVLKTRVLKTCKNLESNAGRQKIVLVLVWFFGGFFGGGEEVLLFLMLSLERIRPLFLQRNHSSLFCTSLHHIRSSAWQSPIFLSCCTEKHSPSHYILGSIPRLAHRCPLFQIFFLLHDTPPQTVVEWAGRRNQSDNNFCFWTYFAPICKCTWNFSL